MLKILISCCLYLTISKKIVLYCLKYLIFAKRVVLNKLLGLELNVGPILISRNFVNLFVISLKL